MSYVLRVDRQGKFDVSSWTTIVICVIVTKLIVYVACELQECAHVPWLSPQIYKVVTHPA